MLSYANRVVQSCKAWYMIAILVASGLVLSYWLYQVLDSRHQRHVVAEFDNLARQRVQVLDNYMQRSLEVLYGLSAFLRHAPNRQLSVFEDYVSGSLQRLPEVQALEWIPIVERSQRSAFEAHAQAQGLGAYRIIEFNDSGQLREASQRPRYYPVYFAYPENTNVEAIGLDLGSQPDRRQAIEASLTSGEIVATAPVRLAQEKQEAAYGFLIFAPVMAYPQASDSAGATQVLGFALVVYRSIDLLATVFEDLAAKGVMVTVVDREHPELTLFSNHPQRVSAALGGAPSSTLDYEMGQRQWQVRFASSEAYLQAKQSTDVYVYPAVCALLVMTFGVYAAMRNRYLFAVERQVHHRTEALTREVAQRRQAQAAAQQAEVMYRSMFENAIDGIFQTTREGVYLNANSALARLYGYTSRDDFMQRVTSIERQLYVDPQRREQFIALMQRDGQVSDFVSEVYRADGSRIHILEKAIAVYDEKGGFLYYEGNVQDITDRVAAERALQSANEWLEERVNQRTQELAQTNRELQEEVGIRLSAEREAAAANAAKTQFLAGVSHEIRTPLNAIIGYSQILQQQPDLNQRHQLAIKTLAQSSDHLLHLIDDILDLSKIESGLVELTSVDFDLAALIGNVTFIVQRKCEEKGLRLTVEGLGSKPLWIHGDEGKLRQILVNLLSNAVKYTDQGEVILRVVPEAEQCFRFEVIDTGPGIPEKDVTRIFDQFFQRAGWQEGTGLGLSIASRLARALGTHIEVRSTPGHGSNFVLRLSFQSATSTVEGVGAGQHKHARLIPGQTCLALIVDDVLHNRDILQHMLVSMGCDVLAADSGIKALEYLKVQMPDIIFMDILMPDMDGIETRKRMLAKHPELCSVFVAFSASAFEEQRQQYREAGFDAVIGKPFRVEQLHQCLARLLQLRFVEWGEEMRPEMDAPCSITPAFAEALIEAARVYHVTQLKRLLAELAQQSAAHRQLAEQWRQLAEQHQLERLISCVGMHLAKTQQDTQRQSEQESL